MILVSRLVLPALVCMQKLLCYFSGDKRKNCR